MRAALIFAFLCSAAVADCVITVPPGTTEREISLDPFGVDAIVFCEGSTYWSGRSRSLSLTWDVSAGSLRIEGDGLYFFDDTAAVTGYEVRYTAGIYGYRQNFGGVGRGYDENYVPDTTVMTVDGEVETADITMEWIVNNPAKKHEIIGVLGAFRDVPVVSAIPEPSAFMLLGLVGLVAAAKGWWRRR